MSASPRTVILFNPRSVRSVGSYTLPIGVMMTAIHVYQDYHVIIIDQAVERHWRQRLQEALDSQPLCMGVTAMTGQQIQRGLTASQLAHERGCPVVWGGIHPSLVPEQTLMHPYIDYVCSGEGEETFAELVRTLDKGGDVRTIRGLWSKADGHMHYGGDRPFINLNELPETPYHLVDLKQYARGGVFGPSVSVYSSRGCPWHCRFCYNHAFHRSHWRAFSAERTLQEIQRIRALCPDLTHIALWDDSFFPDLKRAHDIAAGIAAIRPRLTWSVVGTHVRDVVRMDDEYLNFLKESGLTDVVIGVESGAMSIVQILQKGFQMEQLLASNRRLGFCGIRPTYTFISGIPGETDEDIRKTVDVMFQLKADNPDAILGNIKPFVPYPGTELYCEAVENGFKPPQRLEDWTRFVWGNYTNLDIPWVSKERRKWLNSLYFYTVVLNPEYLFINSRLFSVLARLLLPITTWRVRHLCFKFPLTAKVMALVERLML